MHFLKTDVDYCHDFKPWIVQLIINWAVVAWRCYAGDNKKLTLPNNNQE